MTSRWLKGAYAPVSRECDVDRLEIEGAIPPALNGALVRIGPNPIGPQAEDYNLFLGAGMVHALTLADGQASYRSRWVRTPEISVALGEPPIVEPPDGEDVANTHVMPFGGGLLAMTETCPPYRLDLSLRTEARAALGVEEGFTAHPHVDPADGRLHAFGYEVNGESIAVHHVFEGDGTRVSRTPIALNGPSWVHDFAMTEQYLVLWDLPLQYDATLATAGERAPYRWTPDYPARVGLVAKADPAAPPLWFEVEAGWVFHPVNAEERDAGGALRAVVCDVARFPAMFVKDRTGPGDRLPPQLYRWRMDLTTQRLTETLIDGRVQEYPRIDDRFWAREHRFAVTTELMRRDGGSGLIVHDGHGNAADWGFAPGVVASEAVFVPDNAGAGEGEGWLLCLATDSGSGASQAAVFDAGAVAKGPVARIAMPERVPFTFHGSWMAAS